MSSNIKVASRASASTGRKRSRTIVDELSRLALFASAVYLALALFSYSAADPSWSTWTTTSAIRNWMGRAGSIAADLLFQLFGLSSFSIVIGLLLAARQLGKHEEQRGVSLRYLPLSIFSVTFLAECAIPMNWLPFERPTTGGVIGALLHSGASYVTGDYGALFLAILAALAATIATFRIALISEVLPALRTSIVQHARRMWNAIGSLVKRPKPAAMPSGMSGLAMPSTTARPGLTVAALPDLEMRAGSSDEEIQKLSKSRPSRLKAVPRKNASGNGTFELPSLDLLSSKASAKNKQVDRSWFLEKAEILVQKLKDFGVEGEIVHISPGPVITVYEFKPASGVKIKEIANLSDDLTLALSVLSVRIVAPIPGKPVVGIEIPSPHREMVYFRDLVEETAFYGDEIKIPVALGRLASGDPVVAGLASMPHLLVAGSTGTGKSVFINTLICSLLYRYTPEQLKLILVDPKMVELSSYEGIPHLMLPVVIDSKKAAAALRWTVEEMERRYGLLHRFGVRHIDAYNEKISTGDTAAQTKDSEPLLPLPYIVVVVDEYADLMAVVPKDVELSIARLAQKARASGIHLVLATQRPSTDVVTGTIKANFPSRISFRVASSIDSKTILDRTGADRLLGNGDMLFHSAGFSTLKRMQGAFISDAELERVVEFLRSQGEPEYDERLLQAQESFDSPGLAENGEDESGGGELYDTAVRLVTDRGEASISLLQRHMKIGYNRAASLMEQMEREGVVAPQTNGSSKRRTVLASSI